MDLVSLACQEVGLDLSCDILTPDDFDLPEPFAVQLHITEEERPDRLERMIPRQLSYQPEGPDNPVDQLQALIQEVGMEPSTSSKEHFIRSPVQQLLVQRTKPKFFKRSGSSQIGLGIKGAPCRKVPQLLGNSKSNAATPVKEEPTGSLFEMQVEVPSPVSIPSDNPFKYLLSTSSAQCEPGEVAFAYYVQDSWERQRAVGPSRYSEGDSFLEQCRKWWAELPTVFRREYWAREQEYKRNVEQQRTWGSSQRETEKENIPLKKEKKLAVKKEPTTANIIPLMNEKKVAMKEPTSANIIPLMKEKKVAMKKEPTTANIIPLMKEKKLMVKREPTSASEEPSSLLKAFNTYLAIEKPSVCREMAEATLREVRRELGRRWKLLSTEQKMFYLPSKE